jgi:hypothetical protein
VDGHGVAWDVVDHVTTHCKARITVEPVEHTIIWDTVTAARQPAVVPASLVDEPAVAFIFIEVFGPASLVVVPAIAFVFIVDSTGHH